jgi:serralysin
VDGSIVSAKGTGLVVDGGNSGVSRIVVGAEGNIGRFFGLAANSPAEIFNAGVITAGEGDWAILLNGSGAHKVTNSGVLEGSIVASSSQANGETILNSGLVDGEVHLGAGGDSFTNVRTVNGTVVSGTVRGVIDMGSGNDRLIGGDKAETVMDGNGTDIVALGGGNDLYKAVGADGADGADTVAGGSGADVYDASWAYKAVYINLDTVEHDVGPFVAGGYRVAAGLALGSDVAGPGQPDRMSGFEDADGGRSDDVIYGSTAPNRLAALEGDDWLFGYAGNDRLDGGAGTDILVGGSGRDVVIGEIGADLFSFVKASDSGNTAATRDVIGDFQDGLDRIDLRFIDARPGSPGDDAFQFLGTNVAWGGMVGQLRAVWTASGQLIQADSNGDKVTDFSVLVSDRDYSTQFTSADFLL